MVLGTTLHQLRTSVVPRLELQRVLEPAIPVYMGIGGKVCNKITSNWLFRMRFWRRTLNIDRLFKKIVRDSIRL